jgi:signal transduction histidine kinase
MPSTTSPADSASTGALTEPVVQFWRNVERALLPEPKIADEDLRRRAGLILRLAALMLLFAVTNFLTTGFGSATDAFGIGVNLCVVALFAAIYASVRGGRIRLAESLLAFAIAASITAYMVCEGVTSPRATIAVVAIVAAGFLLSSRYTAFIAITIAAVVGLVGVAQTYGAFLPWRTVAEQAWLPIFRQMLFTTLLILLLRATYDSLRNRLLERERELAPMLDEARRINSGLEQRVAERTAQLEMRRAAQDRIAGSLALELAEPLTRVERLLQDALARSGPLNLESCAHIDRAARAAARAAGMVRMLHAYASLGAAAISLESVDVRAMAAELASELADSGAAVRWRIDDLPRARADPVLLRVALQNVLQNALKYSGQRSVPDIHVGFDAVQQAFFVRDNGVGIDPKDAERIFIPFQGPRLRAARSGHGLGLANALRAIERMDGRIWAAGRLDEGLTVYISLRPEGEP